MSEFKVRLNGINGSASQNDAIARELSQISGEVYDLKQRLRFQIAQRERINRRLAAQGASIASEGQKVRRAGSALKNVSQEYRRTESGLCGTDEKNGNNLWNIIAKPFWPAFWISSPALPSPAPKFDWINNFNEKIFQNVVGKLDVKGEAKFKHVDGKTEGVSKATFKDSEIKDSVSDYVKEPKSRKEYDSQNHKWNTIDKDNDEATQKFDDAMKDTKMDAVVKAGISGSASAAWFHSEGEVTYGIGKLSASGDVAKGEATAEGYVGLFQKDASTGKLVFKPGIGGELGASFSAFTAEEKAEIGNDMLGGYVGTSQTAGKAGAKAEGSVGLFDSTGKFNPSAYAGAKAEALLGEVTAKAGGKILGTDVGVSGSLNYGVGAHANAGYKDGKVYLDVGATLGVGASAKLEIDVSGTVDAVCDGAKAAWNGAKSAWNGVKSWFR